MTSLHEVNYNKITQTKQGGEKMTNLKLKALLTGNGDDMKTLSKVISKSYVTTGNKVRGSVDWTDKEIKLISEYYKLNPQQVWDIFFSSEVYTNETKAS